MLYKDAVLDRGKGIEQGHADAETSIRTTVEVGESSEASQGDQSEVVAGQAEVDEEQTTTTEVTEDLSNYQLARDRVCREIGKPARYTEDSALAFALSVAEEIESEEPRSYEEAMRSKD